MPVLFAPPEGPPGVGIDAHNIAFSVIIGKIIEHSLDGTLQGHKSAGPTVFAQNDLTKDKKYSGVLRREPSFSEVNLQKASKVLLIQKISHSSGCISV